jgi:SAM-dependent methyltransferase
MFLSDRCPEDQVGAFYGAAYQPYQGSSSLEIDDAYPFSKLRFNGLIRGLQRVRFERPIRRVLDRASYYADRMGSASIRRAVSNAYVPTRPSDLFVDYGCGNVDHLNVARTAGWQTVGVDFTPAVIDRVRADGHRGMLASDVATLEDASVGLVRMNHVVEHLYRPRDVLAQLHAKLRPGGLLHLSTPNPDGPGLLLFGRYWMALDIPRHIILFPPRLLARILSEIGYLRVEILMEPASRDLVRSMGYYEAEHGRCASIEVVGRPYDALYSNLIAWPVTIASAFGLADRYHILARK